MKKTVSIGSTTDESSLSDQVQRYAIRKFQCRRAKNDSIQGQKIFKYSCESGSTLGRTVAQECLSNKCINVVVKNFERLPVHENIPARCMREISNTLSIDLDANTAAEFVFDESYWKRRCLQKYPHCKSKISEHGLMWKQLFFETHIQQVHLVILSGNQVCDNSIWRSSNLILM